MTKELDAFLLNVGISLAAKPINEKLNNIEKAENRLVGIRLFNDSSKLEVYKFAEKEYEGKKAELRKPLIGSNSLDDKIVRFDIAVKEDLDAYYEAYSKYDELIYTTLRFIRDGKESLMKEKRQIITGKTDIDSEQKSPDNANLKSSGDSPISLEKENPNKGIKKRIRAIVKELNLKNSEKEISIIKKEVCEILVKDGFQPNEDSVGSMLNQEGVGNLRT